MGKCGESDLPGVWLDTLRVARRAWPQFNDGFGFGIARLAAEFRISFTHHDAAEDARAAGLLLLRAISDTGYNLEDWLKRVDLTLSGHVPGRFVTNGDPSGALAGETVVFTGSLGIPRRTAAKAAAAAGCDVTDSVGKTTTMLVVGNQDLRYTKGIEKSAKHRKADEMIAAGVPIRIIGESDFMLMVGGYADDTAEFVPHGAIQLSPKEGPIRELTIQLTPEAARINDLVENIKTLKRSKDYPSALKLLLAEIESQEEASGQQKRGVAPWYYEQAAIIYRKLDNFDEELAILRRFARQLHAPGAGPSELLRRLEKAESRQRPAKT